MQNLTLKHIVLRGTDIFESIRQIPLKDIIRRYAPTEPIVKHGKFWLLCPFHADKRPSLSLKGNKWKCFGCGVGGDGPDFISRLYGVSQLDAAKMIAKDFGLQVYLGKPLTVEQRQAIRERKRMREIEKVFAQVVDRAYFMLCDVRTECFLIIDNAEWDGLRFSHLPELLDTYLDILQFGNDAEKMKILRSGAVERWTKLLQKIS